MGEDTYMDLSIKIKFDPLLLIVYYIYLGIT